MTSQPKSSVTLIGRTNFRNRGQLFGITEPDRLQHLYVIGKTGTGKSTLLESMIRQDVDAGSGAALLDPHGDLVERVVEYTREKGRNDLLYWNVPDTANPLGFNPLERVEPAKRSLAASGLLDVFKKIWSESWGPRLEHILRNALILLFDQPEATLADVLRLLDDPQFRKRAAERTANAQVRAFWLREYESYTSRFRIEAIAPIQNKVGAFLADPVLQRILTQQKSAFDVRRVMDDGKLFLVNLSKGRLGEDTASLLGGLLVSRIGLSALGRADTPEDARRTFCVYLDEFQSFTTLSLATMLSELRKYHVGLVLSHQYLAQVDERIRDAILGNAGTVIAFRLGVEDAEVLEGEFAPEFSAQDLSSLPNFQIYLRLMIEGTVSRPFSAQTLLPLRQYPGATFLSFEPFFHDARFRKEVLAENCDPQCQAFWQNSSSFPKGAELPFLARVDQFTGSAARHVLCQPQSSFSLSSVLDRGVLLADLSGLDPDSFRLAANLLLARLQVALMRRDGAPEGKRPFVSIVLDEFHLFATAGSEHTFRQLASRSRRMGAGLLLLTQHQSQLPLRVRDEVFGNAGTVISLAVGAKEAAAIRRELPTLSPEDGSLAPVPLESLVSLPVGSGYARIGAGAVAIPIKFRPPLEKGPVDAGAQIKDISWKTHRIASPAPDDPIPASRTLPAETLEDPEKHGSDLSPAERRFVAAVAKAPGLSAGEYGRQLSLNGSRAARIRKSLVARGYLREHTLARKARGKPAVILEPLEPALALTTSAVELGS